MDCSITDDMIREAEDATDWEDALPDYDRPAPTPDDLYVQHDLHYIVAQDELDALALDDDDDVHVMRFPHLIANTEPDYQGYDDDTGDTNLSEGYCETEMCDWDATEVVPVSCGVANIAYRNLCVVCSEAYNTGAQYAYFRAMRVLAANEMFEAAALLRIKGMNDPLDRRGE
jgi:hypothetical protein